MKITELLKKVEKIYPTIEEIIARANDLLPEEKHRSGGYLTIRDAKSNEIILVLACGIIPPEKRLKYLRLSQEKGHRLFNLPGHYSSWESRNPDNNEFGGALKGYRYIYSFSGHQEEADETISLVTFYELESVENSWPDDPDTTICFNNVEKQLFSRNTMAETIFRLIRRKKR